jgi:hypothetical protein
MAERGVTGTVQRLAQYVRGDCPLDPPGHAEDVLVYEAGGVLMCADHKRAHARANPTPQECDSCGATGNVWRDPVHRRNEYLCIKCHDPESLFQNRWADKARESKALGVRGKAVCDAAGYGTDCKGEVKPRGGAFKGRLLCNKHAGKQSVGPEHHQ